MQVSGYWSTHGRILHPKGRVLTFTMGGAGAYQRSACDTPKCSVAADGRQRAEYPQQIEDIISSEYHQGTHRDLQDG